MTTEHHDLTLCTKFCTDCKRYSMKHSVTYHDTDREGEKVSLHHFVCGLCGAISFVQVPKIKKVIV